MLTDTYRKTRMWVQRNRFMLLLAATLLVLVLPAFSGSGPVAEIIFAIAISYLFVQSLVTANLKKSRQRITGYVVVALILITMLKPVGIEATWINVARTLLVTAYFAFVVAYLFRFIRNSSIVDRNVLTTSITVYLLIGYIGGSLAALFNIIYPGAYNFPDHIDPDKTMNFVYYSFITMTTLGYGDITPRIPQTQTLAYLLAITGQLYVAVIIAFLMGKFLMHSSRTPSK
jgi:voltage-gated potassium channel